MVANPVRKQKLVVLAVMPFLFAESALADDTWMGQAIILKRPGVKLLQAESSTVKDGKAEEDGADGTDVHDTVHEAAHHRRLPAEPRELPVGTVQ